MRNLLRQNFAAVHQLDYAVDEGYFPNNEDQQKR